MRDFDESGLKEYVQRKCVVEMVNQFHGILGDLGRRKKQRIERSLEVKLFQELTIIIAEEGVT